MAEKIDSGQAEWIPSSAQNRLTFLASGESGRKCFGQRTSVRRILAAGCPSTA